MGMQWAMDNVELELLRSVTLSRPQIRDLCRRTLERMQRNEHALNPKDVEADVAQYHIDEGLKEIWGEELCPWPARYENMKRCKYGR